MTIETCGNCRFFRADCDSPSDPRYCINGTCRRHAPRSEGIAVPNLFPCTYSGEWCGEYEPKHAIGTTANMAGQAVPPLPKMF